MPIPLGVLAVAGAGAAGAAGAYELLESQVLSDNNSASVTFSNLNSTYGSTYQHLQIRFVVRNSAGGSGNAETRLRFNGDTGSNYAWHHLRGDGSSVTSTAGTSADHMRIGLHPFDGATANIFASGVIDLLDAFETSKNKTARTLVGHNQSTSSIFLSSGFRNNTEALTSVTLLPESNNWKQGSRFSLYGLRSA